eukprot:Sspe_Gene.81124::Locus_51700_Transcript_2_2_Confidence_0.667_Length_2333::g.81124::m.81124/K02355/fusA, GFM, EFG; elongation factor G
MMSRLLLRVGRGPPPSLSAAARRWCSALPVRNIGIIAHVDAGKTTTTERMLYFSQAKSRPGDIHKGNTTTDFMDQERERGITIQSAVVSFTWKNHRVYLIDTPGHVDFTTEVERSLRVLDGAVAIFDATKGVQAQSRTVLQQAAKFNVPFIVFANKMDRPRADFKATMASIEGKLGVVVVPVQYPIVGDEGLEGVVDLVRWRCTRFSSGGEDVVAPLEREVEEVRNGALEWRAVMLDALSGVSNDIAEAYLEALDRGDDAGLTMPEETIRTAIAWATHHRKATPALCGSSVKNRGVTALLDAVLDYLPPPESRPALWGTRPETGAAELVADTFTATAPLVALIFKITTLNPTSPTPVKVALVRVYAGEISAGTLVYNPVRGCAETVRRVAVMEGEEFVPVKSLRPGMVGCLWGVEKSFTGDTLFGKKGMAPLEGLSFPVPIVSTAVEPYSDEEQRTLEKAVKVVQLEDPSLVSEQNSHGQTVLRGMGPLHLEIVKTRLERVWGLQLTLGGVKVIYKEYVRDEHTVTHTFLSVPDNPTSAVCTMTITLLPVPLDDYGVLAGGGETRVDLALGGISNAAERERCRRKWGGVIEKGIVSGLARGPRSYYPICGAVARVDSFRLLRNCGEDDVLSAAAYTAAQLVSTISPSAVDFLEPCATCDITFWEASALPAVRSDVLGQRRGEVLSEEETEHSVRMVCILPLIEASGYSRGLQSLLRGECSYSYELRGYRQVNDEAVVQDILNSV